MEELRAELTELLDHAVHPRGCPAGRAWRPGDCNCLIGGLRLALAGQVVAAESVRELADEFLATAKTEPIDTSAEVYRKCTRRLLWLTSHAEPPAEVA